MAVIQWGASNAGGHNIDANGCNSPPFGVPTSRVDLLRRGLVANETVSDTNFVSLATTAYGGAAGTSHGSELGLGIALANGLPKGTRAAILKVTANSTAITDWLESGGSQNAALQTAISDFKALIASHYPAASIEWHGTASIGGVEGGSGQPDNSAAVAMASNFATFRSQVNGYTGATLKWHGEVEGDTISNQPWLTEERASENSMYDYPINLDDIQAYQSDGRHHTGACQNAKGSREGTSILAHLSG